LKLELENLFNSYKSMDNLNRRRFLKSSLIGAAGMVAMSTDMVAGVPSKQEKKIIYRTLGRTGIKVPVISFGVMRADNPSLVKAAYDKGVFLFDTANGYQGGKNEEMLGVVFKEYPRNSYAIATKVQPATGRDGLPNSDTTAANFLEKFNTSMKRLGLSYVDILYMHGASSAELVNYAPIVDVMKKLKKDGKTKYIGISTHANQPVVIEAMAKAGIWDVVLTSYNFSMTNIKEIDAALVKANEAGMGVVAMKTMAGGGFLDNERTKPINTSAAIKWVLSNPNVHTTIPGMTSFDQLDLNAKIMEDITMNEQEKKDVILAQAETGLFCNGCRVCLPGCKKNLPVPDLMRAYMYAYGYTNRDQAYTLLSELKTGDNPCKECSECTVNCAKNFSVKEKIADISRLVNVPVEFIS
jgi:uncharacterized protein